MMAFYNHFPEYVPVAEKKRRAAAAAEKLKKKDSKVWPVVIRGRKIAATWWGQAWCDNLESYADYSNRIARGRSYVRHGAVLDLQVGQGKVTALVQGSASRPYRIELSVTPLSNEMWQRIVQGCAGKISSLQELAAGKFPKGLSELFTARGKGLFPAPKEIAFSCSCPDYASMCKHVAAVLYGIGARFDDDASLFFALRKVKMDELITASLEAQSKALLGQEGGRRSRRVMEAGDLAGTFGIELDAGASASASPASPTAAATRAAAAPGGSPGQARPAAPASSAAPAADKPRRGRPPKAAAAAELAAGASAAPAASAASASPAAPASSAAPAADKPRRGRPPKAAAAAELAAGASTAPTVSASPAARRLATAPLAKVFKVTLTNWQGAVRGMPYRKLAVRADASLYELAEAVLPAFDFALDHAFGFYDNIKNWMSSKEGYELFADLGDMMEFPGVRGAKVNRVFRTPKQKMLLLFDYGDEWRFIVQYVGEQDLGPGRLPVVLEVQGDAPDQYGGFE